MNTANQNSYGSAYDYEDWEGQHPVENKSVAVIPEQQKNGIFSKRVVMGVTVVMSVVAAGFVVSFNRDQILSSVAPYLSFDTTTTDIDSTAISTIATSKAHPRDMFILPSLTDSEEIHDFIEQNYLLFESWMGDATSHLAPIPFDMPDKEPASLKGAREEPYVPFTGDGYSMIEAYGDPLCANRYGFMAFQLNTCFDAWMFGYQETKTYVKTTGAISESMVTVTTDLYYDADCSKPMTRTANVTVNQGCTAWNSMGNVFTKHSYQTSIPTTDLGVGIVTA